MRKVIKCENALNFDDSDASNGSAFRSFPTHPSTRLSPPLPHPLILTPKIASRSRETDRHCLLEFNVASRSVYDNRDNNANYE